MKIPKMNKKRQSEDDAGSSRHAKKGGRRNREPTYDTYDEAMDGELLL